MIKKAKKMNKHFLNACVATYAFISSAANANLPTATESESASGGDYVGMGKEQAGNVVEVIVMAIGATALAAGAWAMISKFMEVQNQKADWGDFGKTVAGGGVAITIALILITQAGNIF